MQNYTQQLSIDDKPSVRVHVERKALLFPHSHFYSLTNDLVSSYFIFFNAIILQVETLTREKKRRKKQPQSKLFVCFVFIGLPEPNLHMSTVFKFQLNQKFSMQEF